MTESSDKMWSIGEENGKPFQHFSLENPMNSMKRQKDMALNGEHPRSVGAQYATGEGQRNSSRRMKRLSQSGNNAQLWMCLVTKVKSNVVKNSIA